MTEFWVYKQFTNKQRKLTELLKEVPHTVDTDKLNDKEPRLALDMILQSQLTAAGSLG